MRGFPLLQLGFQQIDALIPHTFRKQNQTLLEDILAQHEVLLAGCLKHLAENGWQERPSFGVGFRFYVS